ncbi:hypothetical protein GEMRC1_008812 [Eukaryota sp. GEM-RC1]
MRGKLRGTTQLVPKLKYTCTDRCDFGFIPVGVLSTQTLRLSNTGTAPFDFDFDCPFPFNINPSYGSLDPSSTLSVDVAIFPPECTALISQVLLTITSSVPSDIDSLSSNIELTSISKLPFPFLSSRVLDFESVLPNTTTCKKLFLHNKSLVPLNFTIRNTVDDDYAETLTQTGHKSHDDVTPQSKLVGVSGVFSLFPPQGVIAPNDSVGITVNADFSQGISELSIIDRFSIEIPGLPQSQSFTVEGSISIPSLEISTDCVTFEDVIEGSNQIKEITISNHSNFAVNLMLFLSGCSLKRWKGVFGLASTRISLTRNSTHSILINFSPPKFGHYTSTLYVFTLFKSQLLSVDLLGTAYPSASAVPRPAILSRDSYELFKEVHGLIENASTNLKFLKGNGVFNCKQTEFPCLPEAPTELNNIHEPILPQGVDYINQSIRISTSLIDFQSVDVGPKYSKKIFIENTTHLAQKLNMKFVSQNSVFSLRDAIIELSPLTSKEITVVFEPTGQNELFIDNLEIFAFPKIQRSKNLVSDPRPSSHVILSILGDTYSSSLTVANSAMPIVSFEPKRIVFGSTIPKSTVCRTFMLKNEGDTPEYFNILIFSESKCFNVYPKVGVIPGNSYTIVLLTYRYDGDLPHSLTELHHGCLMGICLTRFVTDLSLKNLKSLPSAFCPFVELYGNISLPRVKFSKQLVNFADTSIGTTSKSFISITNSSFSLFLTYSWKIPEDSCFFVDVVDGPLNGNQDAKVTLYFKPKAVGQYSERLFLTASSSSESNEISQDFFIEVTGQAIESVVEFEPAAVDFGSLVINEKHIQSIKVKNNSSAPVNCQFVSVSHPIGHLSDSIKLADQPPTASIILCPSSTLIPARGYVAVDIEITPNVIGRIDGTISAVLPFKSSATTLNITSLSVRPSFLIDQATCYRTPHQVSSDQHGIPLHISGANSLCLSGFVKLNSILRSDITPGEIKFSGSSRFIDGDSSKLMKMLQSTDVYFPVAAQGEPDSTIVFDLYNHNVCPVSVQLLTRNSFKLSVEPWAIETINRTSDELPTVISSETEGDGEPSHDEITFEHEEFTIEPHSSFSLKFRASHSIPGLSDLQVVFSVFNGKTFVCNFHSQTYPKSLSFVEPETTTVLPVCIQGCVNPLAFGNIEILKEFSNHAHVVDFGELEMGQVHFNSLILSNISTFPVELNLIKQHSSKFFEFTSFNQIASMLLQRNSSIHVDFKIFGLSLGKFSEILTFECQFLDSTPFYFKIALNYTITNPLSIYLPLRPNHLLTHLPISTQSSRDATSLTVLPSSVFCFQDNQDSDIFSFKFRPDSFNSSLLNRHYLVNNSEILNISPHSALVQPNSSVTCTVLSSIGNVSSVLDLRCVIVNESKRKKLIDAYEILRKKWVTRDRNDDSTDEEGERDDFDPDQESTEPQRSSVHLTATVSSVARSRVGLGSSLAPSGFRSVSKPKRNMNSSEFFGYSSRKKKTTPIDDHSHAQLDRLRSLATSQSFRPSQGDRKRQQSADLSDVFKLFPKNFGSQYPEDAANAILSFSSIDLFTSISFSPQPAIVGHVNSAVKDYSRDEVDRVPRRGIQDVRKKQLVVDVSTDFLRQISEFVQKELNSRILSQKVLNDISSKQSILIDELLPKFDRTRTLLGDFKISQKSNRLKSSTVKDSTVSNSFKILKRKQFRRVVDDVIQNAIKTLAVNMTENCNQII